MNNAAEFKPDGRYGTDINRLSLTLCSDYAQIKNHDIFRMFITFGNI